MPPNPDLAAYLLGRLGPAERARFEQELAADPVTRASAAELAGTVSLLGVAAEPFEVPAGLEARTFRALERAIAEDQADAAPPAPAPRSPRARVPFVRRFALAGAVAMALGAGVLVGSELTRDEGPAGEPELEAALTAPGKRATAVVRETGIGRVIAFRTDDLPILPKGDYYALWFVGPEDSPSKPDRISAGTFHPARDGSSDVEFSAAVDPAKYPVLAVTREKGDGNPAPTFPDVLRSEPAD